MTSSCPHFLPGNRVLSIQSPKLGLVLTLPLLPHLPSLLVTSWSFSIISMLLVPAIFLQAPHVDTCHPNLRTITSTLLCEV